VGRGAEALQLRLHRLRAFHPLGRLDTRQCPGGTPRLDTSAGRKARSSRGAAGGARDRVGEAARLSRAGIPRDGLPFCGAGAARAPAAESLTMAGVPFDLQLLNLCAALLLLLSFAMLTQRRIVNLVKLLAVQGAVLFAATLLLAWRTGQSHLYLSAALTSLSRSCCSPGCCIGSSA